MERTCVWIHNSVMKRKMQQFFLKTVKITKSISEVSDALRGHRWFTERLNKLIFTATIQSHAQTFFPNPHRGQAQTMILLQHTKVAEGMFKILSETPFFLEWVGFFRLVAVGVFLRGSSVFGFVCFVCVCFRFFGLLLRFCIFFGKSELRSNIRLEEGKQTIWPEHGPTAFVPSLSPFKWNKDATLHHMGITEEVLSLAETCHSPLPATI